MAARTSRLLTLAAAAVAPWVTAAALAQPGPGCRVAPFRGATSPEGAVAQMTVVNTGAGCTIANFGVPAERRNPAQSGTITVAPSRGSARFVAPDAVYTPAAGQVGDDEFAYEAEAQDGANRTVRLKVRVQVRIVAP